MYLHSIDNLYKQKIGVKIVLLQSVSRQITPRIFICNFSYFAFAELKLEKWLTIVAVLFSVYVNGMMENSPL